MYIITSHSDWAGCDTRSMFLRQSLTGIQGFPSLRMVAKTRLKNLVCSTIYLLLEVEFKSYFSQWYQCYVKCNKPRLEVKLMSPCLFSTTINITPRYSLKCYTYYFIPRLTISVVKFLEAIHIYIYIYIYIYNISIYMHIYIYIYIYIYI